MRSRSVPVGRSALILLVSLVLVGLVGVPAASAKNYRCMVINDRINTTYFSDVQGAIDDAEPGDTLWIRGDCSDTTLSITKSLTLTGQDIRGFLPPRINANRLGTVVHVSGAEVQVEINSLSLTGGGDWFDPVDYGGGIRNDESTLTLNDVTICSNGARWGGGIFNAGGDVVINGSTIVDNHALPGGEGGGGIYTVGGSLTLQSSRVADNTAYGPGGGLNARVKNPITGTNDYTGTVVVSDTTIQGNQSSDRGGGIAFYSHGSLTVTDTTVQGNESYGSGGGISIAGTATLTHATISDNVAHDQDGGGIGIDSGTVTLSDTTVQSNHAARGGGLRSFGPVTLAGTSALASNIADDLGGGAYLVSPGHLTLTGPDASIHDNSAASGGGIYASAATALTNCIDYVNVYDNTPENIFLVSP